MFGGLDKFDIGTVQLESGTTGTDGLTITFGTLFAAGDTGISDLEDGSWRESNADCGRGRFSHGSL